MPTRSTGRVVAIFLLLASIASLGFAQETARLHQAILQKQVVVTSRGAGIQTVTGTVRRTPGTGPLVLTIPVGTLFVAGSGVQNMVTVAPATVDLTTADSANFSVSVACANMRLDIPSSANAFTVEPAPRQEALSLVLPVLAETGAPYPVTQAAVWIVTDNATYGDLGILVRGSSRIINEPEAAQAMMTIERAGGDLRRRRIWQDRQQVCKGIGTAGAELTAWCERILADGPSDTRVGPPGQPDSPPQRPPLTQPQPPPQTQSPVQGGRNWWRDPPRRLSVRWNASYQVFSELFTSATTFPLYRDTAQLTSDYSLGPGAVLDGRDIGVSGRVSNHVGIGLSRVRIESSYKANVEGVVPHPSLLGFPRSVSGSAGDFRRSEEAWHLEVAVMGGGPSWEISAFAGPSLFLFSQELVQAATVRETLSGPLLVAISKQSVTTTERTGGFNAGVDGSWMFARYVGVGGSFRYSRSRLVEFRTSGTPTQMVGGGIQLGFGLRFRL